MNYIREIKAFYDLVQVKQLSTGQIGLWHALMNINNKCAWIEWFTAPNLTLELTTGLSRKGIYKARNVLKQHGIIDFKSNGTKATSYRLISLQHNTQGSTQDSTQDSTQGSTQDSTQDSATLTKLNETKRNDSNSTTADKEFSEIAKLYQDVIGNPNSLTADWITSNLDGYGFTWLKNAMLEAEKRGKRNKSYVEAILSNWKSEGGMRLATDKKQTGNKDDAAESIKKYGW